MKLKTLLILAIGLAGSNTALAGHDHRSSNHRGDSWAREYAETAIRQVRQNRNRGCGYYGQRWSDRYNEHYRWALRVDRRKSQGEINQRDKDLRICASRQGYADDRHYRNGGNDRGHRGYSQPGPQGRLNRDERARWYADTTLAQLGESRRYGCRLSSSSGRWSRSWRSHYNWALGQSRQSLMAEVRSRERRLDNCTANAYRDH